MYETINQFSNSKGLKKLSKITKSFPQKQTITFEVIWKFSFHPEDKLPFTNLHDATQHYNSINL